jgi:hypothetical protein
MTTLTYGGIRSVRRNSRRLPRPTLARYCFLVIAGFFAVNLIYQIARKPAEAFAPISQAFAKHPAMTWRHYGALFERHSTTIISAEFLAALAQVESAGNPLARTGWRWQWSWSPFEIYRPPSSAVGMFQMTDGTFAQARKFCIRNHTVVKDGPWHNWSSCWYNRFYIRTSPSHSIEMTAAYLDESVRRILVGLRSRGTSLAEKEKLAAVIHLCGAKRGALFAERGFRVTPGERCGAHGLQRYLTKIVGMKKQFARQAVNRT